MTCMLQRVRNIIVGVIIIIIITHQADTLVRTQTSDPQASIKDR